MREILAGIFVSSLSALGIYLICGLRWAILAAIIGFMAGVVVYLRERRD